MNTMILVIGGVVLVGIGVLVYFLTRKKDTEGFLSMKLKDSPTEELSAINITINKIHVNKASNGDDNWIEFPFTKTTFDLLTLVGGVFEKLGLTSMEAGIYNQIRLELSQEPTDNYVIDNFGETHTLKVPSNALKLVHPFEVVPGLTVDLILDFDASKSIVIAGQKKKKFILKPTIKVVETKDNATLNGLVTDENGGSLRGATVTAQKVGIAEISDSTITSEDGKYQIYLEPGTYMTVIKMIGYALAWQTISVELEDIKTLDFKLNTSPNFKLFGNITNTNVSDTLNVTCLTKNGNKTSVVVKSMDINCDTEEGTFAYEMILPAGEYSLVIKSSKPTKWESTKIVDADVELNIEL